MFQQLLKHISSSLLTICLLSLISCLGVPHAQAYQYGPIRSADEFSKLLKSVKAGDTLIIEDGQYDGWSVTLDSHGTTDLPVTLKPETPQGVTFTGKTHFKISGQYIRMRGFVFDHCDLAVSTIEFDRSENCSIEESTFQQCAGQKAVVTILPGARNNRVSACRFIGIAGRSVQVRINEDISAYGIPTGNVIRKNLFQDTPPLGGNGRETIQIGQNQPTFGHIMANTIVEENTFVRSDGEAEIISNKCSGNSYRRNVFIDCQGELVMRGGSYCLIEANRFIGCNGGIRICGTNHTLRDNVILNSRGTGIRLFYGMTREQGGHYQAASQCLITNNTIVNAEQAGILVGDARDKDWQEKGIQNVAPRGNQIIDNIIMGSSGDLLIADNAPENKIEGTIFHRRGHATISHPGKNPIFILNR